MTREEQMQKLSAISNYCCAQKDKDALDAAIKDCKKLQRIEQIVEDSCLEAREVLEQIIKVLEKGEQE